MGRGHGGYAALSCNRYRRQTAQSYPELNHFVLFYSIRQPLRATLFGIILARLYSASRRPAYLQIVSPLRFATVKAARHASNL